MVAINPMLPTTQTPAAKKASIGHNVALSCCTKLAQQFRDKVHCWLSSLELHLASRWTVAVVVYICLWVHVVLAYNVEGTTDRQQTFFQSIMVFLFVYHHILSLAIITPKIDHRYDGDDNDWTMFKKGFDGSQGSAFDALPLDHALLRPTFVSMLNEFQIWCRFLASTCVGELVCTLFPVLGLHSVLPPGCWPYAILGYGLWLWLVCTFGRIFIYALRYPDMIILLNWSPQTPHQSQQQQQQHLGPNQI